MKTVKLTIAKEYVAQAGGEVILSTYELLKMVINYPKEGGYKVEEMMERLRVLNIVETKKNAFKIDEKKKIEDYPKEFFDTTESIKLEDADYDKLKEWVKNMKWGIMANFIVKFHDQFK